MRHTSTTGHLDPAIVDAVRDGIRGDVLRPGDAGYDEARTLWNAVVDRHPAAIVRCRTHDDVVHAVNCARDGGAAVAVRSGGHNVAGLSSIDGGVVIDLSEMNAVEVDPATATATVTAQGGATIGDLDRATQAHGLAVPMGVVSATGVAGLTLGGGMGWLRRRYGLACDALVGATVVTADGRTVRAGDDGDAELLWALRGGGGAFGIVTSFRYRAYAVGPDVAFAITFYPLSEARRVFRAHEAYLHDEPGTVSTLFALGRLPREEHVPERLHGHPFAAVLAMHAGDPSAGWEALRPLREICEPLLDLGGVMPYLDAQQVFDADYPDGLRYYWKSISLPEIDDDVLSILVEHAERAPSDLSTLDVWHNDGAMAEPAPDASAYGRRDARYLVNAEANWERADRDDANIAWARACLAALEPYGSDHLYLNFAGFHEEGERLARAAYGPNYARLAELKARYDPTGLLGPGYGVRQEGAQERRREARVR